MKKGVSKNFTKLTGKRLCQSLFLIKKNTLFTKHLWRTASSSSSTSDLSSSKSIIDGADFPDVATMVG